MVIKNTPQTTDGVDGLSKSAPSINAALDDKECKEPDVTLDRDDGAKELEQCGIGFFKPGSLQRFRKIGYFSFSFAIAGMMNFALGSYYGTQIPTIESHFNMSSSTTGTIMTIADIGYFITCLFFGYFTRRVHIPRWLFAAVVLYGLSGILCTIPYFGTRNLFIGDTLGGANGTGAANKVDRFMCSLDHSKNNSLLMTTTAPVSTDENDDDDNNQGGIFGISSDWRQTAIILLCIANLAQGLSRSMKFSFFPVYIDDNSKEGHFSKYMGFTFCLEIFGPAVAMVLGGVFSKWYITLEETSLSPNDPRFLGAWWLGFLIFGVLSLVTSLPLLLFPKRLNLKKSVKDVEKQRKLQKQESRGKNNNVLIEAKAFSRQIIRLLINPLFMMLVIASSLDSIQSSAAHVFTSKFNIVYFDMSPATVNIVRGVTGPGTTALGILAGGYMASAFKLSPFNCLQMRTGAVLLGALLKMLMFVVPCEQPHIVNNQDVGLAFNQTSLACVCDPSAYFPVCGDDGQTYFSPCVAGCTDTEKDGAVFTGCTLLNSTMPGYQSATGGTCDRNCDRNFWIYEAMNVILGLIRSLTAMPYYVTVLRSVSEQDKPLANGLWSFMWTLIGTIPGPLIIGSLMDSACDIQNGGSGGSCLLYDMPAFRLRYLGLGVVFELASFLIYCAALVYAKCSSNRLFLGIKDDEHDVKKDEKNDKETNNTNEEKMNNNNSTTKGETNEGFILGNEAEKEKPKL